MTQIVAIHGIECIDLTISLQLSGFLDSIPNDCDYSCCGFNSMMITNDAIDNAAIGRDVKSLMGEIDAIIEILNAGGCKNVAAVKNHIAASDICVTRDNFMKIKAFLS